MLLHFEPLPASASPADGVAHTPAATSSHRAQDTCTDTERSLRLAAKQGKRLATWRDSLVKDRLPFAVKERWLFAYQHLLLWLPRLCYYVPPIIVLSGCWRCRVRACRG